MRVAFLSGKIALADNELVDAQNLYTARPLTGSELGFFNAIQGLRELGVDVDVFCPVAKPVRAAVTPLNCDVYDLNDRMQFDNTNYDAYVTLSEPDLLRRTPSNKLRIVQQQINDFRYCKDGYDGFVDIYAALSPAHAKHLKESVPEITPHKVTWIPNSINPEFFEGNETRVPHSMVWCSSPDRGLHRLLEIFPLIRKRVPDASLKIFYRFEPWYEAQKDQISKAGARARYINECFKRLGRSGENGIKLVGPIGNKAMIRELMRTQVFPYTSDCLAFTEGFSVATLDACAAGVVPLVSDADALGDLYRNVAHVIPGRPADHKDEWIDAIIRALTDEPFQRIVTERAQSFSRKFNRNKVAQLWKNLLEENVNRQRNPIYSIPPTVQEYVSKNDSPNETKFQVGSQPIAVDFVMNENCVGVRAGDSRAFDPLALLDDKRGLSGTDINFFGCAFAMARRGHKVRVFVPLKHETELNGVQIFQYARFHSTNPAEVSIAHYDMASLSPSRAKLNIAVQHTIIPPSPEFYKSGRVDISLTPSQHNLEHLRANYAPNMPWYVLPNANDWGDFQKRAVIPGRMIYHTSPERGLHLLLRVLPQIRKEVPNAHIRFIGDTDHLAWYEQHMGSKHRDIALEIRMRLEKLGPELVQMAPRSSRNKILAELANAQVYAYPSDPPIPCEVAPVSILDCFRAGVPVVMMPSDGIEKLYGEAVLLAKNLDDFTHRTIQLLKASGTNPFTVQGNILVSQYTFDKQAALLESILERHLGRATIAPPKEVPSLPLYQGL
jgi:glycosyltransferase involved in cell wall biosynthesis